jgi:hypothetical protein
MPVNFCCNNVGSQATVAPVLVEQLLQSSAALMRREQNMSFAQFCRPLRLEWAPIQRKHRAALPTRNDVTIGT